MSEDPVIATVLSDVINECQSTTIHNIQISVKTRGFILRIGCAEFAFETKTDMLDALGAYLNDPIDAEKAYYWRMSELRGEDDCEATCEAEPQTQAQAQAREVRCTGGAIAHSESRARSTPHAGLPLGYPDQG